MSRIFKVPTIISADDALINSGGIFSLCGKKAFIVTGKHVSKLKFFDMLLKTLKTAKIDYEIFSQITGEPTEDMITEGAMAYKDSGCDFLIGIGGGSPLDSIKAIVVLSVLGGNLSGYMGKNISAKLPPMIAIPTTAGTGSEVTKFTIITDAKNDVKMLLKGDDLIPDYAIVDPLATLDCPQSVTAATGLDALTHAVEAYTSKQAQPLTDAVAISAVKRIFKYLPIAYENGNDTNARSEMAIASLEAGIAINNASVTLVHGMSRPIGALFHVPHGVSNAMLLPKCIEFAVDGATEKFACLARTIGIDEDDDLIAAKEFAIRLRAICKICDIPTLKGYGIDEIDFFNKIDKMATDALISGSPQNTLKTVTEEDIKNLYRKIYGEVS